MEDILQQLRNNAENQFSESIELIKIEVIKELSTLLDLWINVHTTELEKDQ